MFADPPVEDEDENEATTAATSLRKLKTENRQPSLPRSRITAWLAILLASLPGCARIFAAEFIIDFSRTNGVIRPLHGVNGGPLCYRGVVDLTTFHRQIAVPLTRLHDVVWVNADAVDIHTLFPDFRDDPALAENYDFRATDDYVQSVLNTGAGIVYRLGESIEHTPNKYWVNPPADPAKWAAICLGVIRHYNEGWAKGFRHGITYWEIWNEPDVRPQMWTGSDEEFFRLFEVTAKAIKARFPTVKVGGPAAGGTGTFVGETFQPTAFLTRFLAYCRDHQVPLDFFSWHRYTANPRDLPRHAQEMRQLLDRHGYARTESHLNEWNYLPNDDWRPMLKDGQGPPREAWYRDMHGPAGAAFATTALLLFQDSPLDAANYYTGEIQGFGLFDYQGTPKKTFHAFRAFQELTTTRARVAVAPPTHPEVAIAAGLGAAGQSRATVLASLTPKGHQKLDLNLAGIPWSLPMRWEALVIDAQGDLRPLAQGQVPAEHPTLSLELEGPAVVLLRLR